MYLFLFAALWIVFQYANSKKVYEDQEKQIATAQKRLEKARDSVTLYKTKLDEATYFTLDGNDNAYTYFENEGYSVAELRPFIEDQIYAQNTPEGNVLIPFEGYGRPFQINKVRVLNHKWLIADFSDGKTWGELLVRYDITEDNALSFNTVESLVYPE